MNDRTMVGIKGAKEHVTPIVVYVVEDGSQALLEVGEGETG